MNDGKVLVRALTEGRKDPATEYVIDSYRTHGAIPIH